MKYSVVIPVYRNAESVPRLIAALEGMERDLAGEMEVVFVVDGSPDESYAMLHDAIGSAPQLRGGAR